MPTLYEYCSVFTELKLKKKKFQFGGKGCDKMCWKSSGERKGKASGEGTGEVIKMEQRVSEIWKMWEKGQKGERENATLSPASMGPAASHVPLRFGPVR